MVNFDVITIQLEFWQLFTLCINRIQLKKKHVYVCGLCGLPKLVAV